VPNRIADPDNAPALAAIAARHLSPELREFFDTVGGDPSSRQSVVSHRWRLSAEMVEVTVSREGTSRDPVGVRS
jgi:hypothetical protein